MSGGASVSALPITRPILASDAWNWGYLVASFCGKLPDFLRGLFDVLVENERAAIGRQRSHRDLGRDHVQAVLLQLHVADDVGPQRPGGVREGGAAKAGMKFFGDGRATGLRRGAPAPAACIRLWPDRKR